MDLPTELRLMVYERIPIRKHHRTVYHDEETRKTHMIGFITGSIDVQLLATCKQIHDEAASFMLPKVKILRATMPQLTMAGKGVPLTADLVSEILFWHLLLEKESNRASFGAEADRRGLFRRGTYDLKNPDFDGEYCVVEKSAMYLNGRCNVSSMMIQLLIWMMMRTKRMSRR